MYLEGFSMYFKVPWFSLHIRCFLSFNHLNDLSPFPILRKNSEDKSVLNCTVIVAGLISNPCIRCTFGTSLVPFSLRCYGRVLSHKQHSSHQNQYYFLSYFPNENPILKCVGTIMTVYAYWMTHCCFVCATRRASGFGERQSASSPSVIMLVPSARAYCG